MRWLDSLNAAALKDTSKLSLAERQKTAEDLVMLSSFGAAAVTYVPIPLSDFFLVTPVQASMVMYVGRVYGRKLELSEAKEILIELGAVCGVGIVAQKGFATLSKIILPGLGGFIAGPYAFAVTYGLGQVAKRYFEKQDATRESLSGTFSDAVKRAKGLFSREKLEEFRRRQGKDVEEFARAHADGSPRRGKPARRAAPRKVAGKTATGKRTRSSSAKRRR